ncbi:MAG: hypothetical protein V2A76_03700 [Planctomycetota bacterium]
MVTDFQDRLRQIREAKTRELEDQAASKPADSLDCPSVLELRIDHRERIEKVILDYAKRFISEVPAFSLSKSFFEGKYKIEVRCEDLLIRDGGQLRKGFSRITFLIDPEASHTALPVNCKKTVRSRDQEGASTGVEASDESREEFRGFVDDQFCEFASNYFAGQRLPTSN